jgi:hypothetical protein
VFKIPIHGCRSSLLRRGIHVASGFSAITKEWRRGGGNDGLPEGGEELPRQDWLSEHFCTKSPMARFYFTTPLVWIAINSCNPNLGSAPRKYISNQGSFGRPNPRWVSVLFPGVVGPRVLLPWVGFLGRLDVAPVETCHPFSRGFNWVDIPVSLGRERISWVSDAQRLYRCRRSAPLPRRKGVLHL